MLQLPSMQLPSDAIAAFPARTSSMTALFHLYSTEEATGSGTAAAITTCSCVCGLLMCAVSW
jgi:hypothetical protein